MRKPKLNERVRLSGKIFDDRIYKDGEVISQLGTSRYKIKLDRGDVVCASMPFIEKILK